MFGIYISKKKKVGAVLGGIAWALLGVSLAKMFGGDFESQVLVAVCDATAGALVWLAFDAPPSRKYGYIHSVEHMSEEPVEPPPYITVSRQPHRSRGH